MTRITSEGFIRIPYGNQMFLLALDSLNDDPINKTTYCLGEDGDDGAVVAEATYFHKTKTFNVEYRVDGPTEEGQQERPGPSMDNPEAVGYWLIDTHPEFGKNG